MLYCINKKLTMDKTTPSLVFVGPKSAKNQRSSVLTLDKLPSPNQASTNSRPPVPETSVNRKRFVRLRGHVGEVMDVSYTIDGQHVVSSGSGDSLIKMWAVDSGECTKTLNGHSDEVFASAVHPTDPTQLLSCSADKTAILWSLDTGGKLRTFTGHTEWVWHVEWGPAGKWFMTCSNDKTARLWYPNNGSSVAVLEGHTAPLRGAGVSATGRFVVTSSYDKTVRVWRIEEKGGQELGAHFVATLEGHTSSIMNVQCHPSDDDVCASAGSDCTVRLWKASTELIVASAQHSSLGSTSKLRGKVLSGRGAVKKPPRINGSVSSQIGILHGYPQESLESWTCSGVLRMHTSGIRSIRWSPRGDRLVTGANDQTAIIWQVASKSAEYVLRAHTAHLQGVAFSPTRNQVASAGGDGSVILWNYTKGASLRTADARIQTVHGDDGKSATCTACDLLSCGSDTRRLVGAVVSADGTLAIFDTATASLLTSISLPAKNTQLALRFLRLRELPERFAESKDENKDGMDMIATAGSGGEIYILSLSWTSEASLFYASLTLVRTLALPSGFAGDPSGDIRGLDWSGDGKMVAAAWHWSVRVFDAKSGELLHSLSGHQVSRLYTIS